MNDKIGLHLLLRGTVVAVHVSLYHDWLVIEDEEGQRWKVAPLLAYAFPEGISKLDIVKEEGK